MNRMKIILLNIFLFISGTIFCQTVNADITYTSSSTLRVTFTNTGTISGTQLTSIAIWIRLLNTTTANTDLATSGANPFNLAFAGETANGSHVLYRFSQLLTLSNPNSVFPINTPVVIADFNITGSIIPSTAELMVVSGFLNFISLVIDNSSNALIWPSGTGLRPMDSALPVHIQSFTAQKLNYNSSLLNWKSLSEEDASHFDIEKSLDAENWVYVGTEKTRGSLNYGAEYSFVDENAVLLRNDENTVYYRLKMVDNDGSFQYSDVRLVTFERSLTDVEVYPNPSHEFFNWKMGVGDTQVHDAQLQLFDMTGKLVKKQTVSANGISKVDIAELETGLYNIVVKHEDQIYRKRIIKTN